MARKIAKDSWWRRLFRSKSMPEPTAEIAQPAAVGTLERPEHWQDLNRADLDKELADRMPELAKPVDQLGNPIERHDGPGIAEMKKTAEGKDLPARGVDQYLFNRDEDKDAPPTSNPESDPSLASAGWTGTRPPDGGAELADYLSHREQGGAWSGTGAPDGGAQLKDYLNNREQAEVGKKEPGTLEEALKDKFKSEEQAKKDREEQARREQEAREKAAQEQREKQERENKEREEKEKKEREEREAKEKAEKEAKEKEEREKKEKEAKEKADKDKKKKHSDPDQVEVDASSVPDALREAPRLLHDPTGAGVSYVVQDEGEEEFSIDDAHRPHGDVGTPDKDPDYYEATISPDAPSKLNTAPVYTVNPLDAPPAPSTGSTPTGGPDPEHEHHTD